MIHLDNDPTGQNYQRPDAGTTAGAGPAIDDELAGDLHGPGQTSRGPATVNIKGQVKGGRSLSKRGKKAIIFGGAGIAALILGGVMMAGHHGGGASSPSVELAGAGNAPKLKPRSKPLSSAVASTLSAHTHGATGAQHHTAGSKSASSALTTGAATNGGKPPLTPAQKYAKWLETQHYKDLEGQHLAGQAALVSTGNWQAAKTPTTLPVSAVSPATGYPAPGVAGGSLAGGIPAGYLQGAPGGGQQSLHGAAANEAFVKAQRDKKEKDQGYLTAHLHAPVSHSELFSGSVIPAVLITGINSQLPGEITAQVRQNVYNSLNPGEVVIPQGSKLTGVYDSGVQYGQSRVLVAWSRVIYPNGETVDLRGMSGVDGLGEAGFSQITDNHYMKIFGSAFLISLLGAGAQLAQPQQSSALSNPGMGQTATGAISQEMDAVGGDMLQKNLNIAPTLKIRPGYLFNVLVSKTMILPQYRP